MSRQLAYVMQVYEGSSGDATRLLYERLESFGPVGLIAVNLFRAQKNSARAKVYRGRGYKDAAYGRKQWAMENLTKALVEHADSAQIVWGWGMDNAQPYHKHVLYIDLPPGQVSFHTEDRGPGPEYPREWDGVRNVSPQRICAFVASVLDGPAAIREAS